MALPAQIPDKKPRPVPVEVYLRCSDWEPDAEYVDGEIEERPRGEYDHAAWQSAIQKWFWKHEEEWNVEAIAELRVQVAATRFRVPDVTILDRNQPVEQIVTRAPVAVFEILSPEDTYARLMRKLKDYAAMGIPHIWVIDPKGPPAVQRYSDGQLFSASRFEDPARNIGFEIEEIRNLIRIR
ncbi:MAG: Uma2 family endonuclease [Acidobacteriaceae bacterium]|jgi:Uma2 family endonuclease